MQAREIVYGNDLQGLDPRREIAVALDRLPYGAPRRALQQTMRPAASSYARTVREAEDALRAVLKTAQDQFDAALRAAPPGDPFRVEHEAREAAAVVTTPARESFGAAVEQAKAAFRAELADAVAEAKRL